MLRFELSVSGLSNADLECELNILCFIRSLMFFLPVEHSGPGSVQNLVQQLHNHVYTKKSKNVEILHLAAEVSCNRTVQQCEVVAALELCHYTDILKNTLNAEMKHETETLEL